MTQRTYAELAEHLDTIRQSPLDGGTVRLIVRRPAVDGREVLAEADLEHGRGMVGDTWAERGSTATPDGGPDERAQVTVMNWRAVSAVAVSAERCPLAGDQLYVDLNLSEANLPAGTRLHIGSAVLEVSGKPHTGCAKFKGRFGADALRFVNTGPGRELRLRGINTRVIASGRVRTGDRVRVERAVGAEPLDPASNGSAAADRFEPDASVG